MLRAAETQNDHFRTKRSTTPDLPHPVGTGNGFAFENSTNWQANKH